MKSTFTLNEEGHCKLGLPCSSPEPCLPYNHSIVMPRLNTLRKKFQREEAMVTKSKAQIRTYLDKGFAQQEQQDGSAKEIKWYLPHDGVVMHCNKPQELRVLAKRIQTRQAV